ncbi:MAG: PKD domain-containing protein [Saprospiraceae bacterium]|nr:PKD domain-containing protein [Saprospiraceae bacterium]
MDKKFTVAYKNKIYGYLAAMEGLQAVRHGNGRDWWFVLKERGSARFNIYLHTPNGLFGPYNQTIGPVWEYPLQIVQATFSPDGNYYAIASQANGIHLFHFDRCTGELYRYLPLKYPPEDYRFYPMGFAFSPNSKVLYLSSYFSIYQYDLEARVIVNSYTLIDTLDGFSPPGSFPLTFYQLNLAPDHKIYCNTTNETNVLHVIHDPDKKGKACNLKQHDIYLPTSYIQSMPNFPPYRLYDKDGSICDTLGIDKVVHADFRYQQDTSQYLSFNFIDLTAYQPEAWQWNFGDPASANNTSTEQNPYHRFSAEGTYSVCLTAYNKHGSSEACKTIQIGTVNTKNNKAPYKFSKVLLQSPNPVCEILQININEYFPKNLQLYLINRLGQQVLSQRIYHGNNAVSLQGIKSGIYWAQWVESGRIVHSESLYIDGTGY